MLNSRLIVDSNEAKHAIIIVQAYDLDVLVQLLGLRWILDPPNERKEE